MGREVQIFSSRQTFHFFCRFALLLPFLLALATVFVVRHDVANGVVTGKGLRLRRLPGYREVRRNEVLVINFPSSDGERVDMSMDLPNGHTL
jgi:hypothetical protein